MTKLLNTFSYGILLWLCSAAHCILSNLKSFEIIHPPNIRIQRAIQPIAVPTKLIFHTKTKAWCLDLNARLWNLPEQINYKLIGVQGTRSILGDMREFTHYSGHLCDSSGSVVLASIDLMTQQLSAKITTKSDIFYLEPLSSYVQYRYNTSILFYKLSDVKPPRSSEFCATDFVNPAGLARSYRTWRSSIRSSFHDKTLCRLTFIVDYAFFKNVGDLNEPKTIRIIVSLFHRLNALFQTAKFLIDEAVEQSGFGFVLGDIIIHDSWNPVPGHYNAKYDVGGKPWSPHSLSEAFNRAAFNKTCLAHLLTYRPFIGVLGRAWTAAPELGGICSPPGKDGDHQFHTNTGWTTYSDHSGRRLLNAMTELITAHELGHNWGAAHDPDTPECSPSALGRGKYLMYAHTVAGFAQNNHKFSPCSRRTIGATLAVRAPLCFLSPTEGESVLCGNRRLDPGEECDAGAVQHDPCCNADCKLRPGAKCSPWNHECCTQDCQITPAATPCSDRQSSNPCLSAVQCDGISPVCPAPIRLSGDPCMEHGQCVNGSCQPYCVVHGLRTCLCDAPEQSCYICCLFPQANSTPSFTCKPVTLHIKEHWATATKGRYSFVSQPPANNAASEESMVFLHFSDYRPCATGYCQNGKCLASKHNSILRFWGLFNQQDDRWLKTFFQNNLVVFIITTSLIVWIPVARGLHIWNRRKKRVATRTV